MATLFTRHHPAQCPLVLPLCLKLPRLGGDDAGTGYRGRPLDDQSLGVAVRAELDKRIRPHLKPTNDSWRTDQTYLKIKGLWKYLYRAVDSEGNTLDFMLSATRDGKAAARFFRKVLKAQHIVAPRVINVDKNAAYPVAMETLQGDETVAEETQLRQSK